MTIPELDRLLEAHIRPQLREHGGDAEIFSYDQGVLRLRMLGRCAGCPAADLTKRHLVPALRQVILVHQASEDLLREARRRMTRGGGP